MATLVSWNAAIGASGLHFETPVYQSTLIRDVTESLDKKSLDRHTKCANVKHSCSGDLNMRLMY